MKKSEYMSRLEGNLKGVGILEPEISDILSIYEEHFIGGKEEGKTEEEIAVRLGDPDQVAAEYCSDDFREESTLKEGVFVRIKKISGIIAAGGVRKFFLSFPFVLIFILILSLWLALSFFVPLGAFGVYAGIANIIMGTVPGFPLLQLAVHSEWFIIFLSISFISGGGLISIGIYSLIRAYLGFMIKQIQ
jgi:uncharacterized membrane protein